MNREEKTAYWITSAGNDWRVAGHLFEKEDYAYALFLGHLTVEKLLKGVYAKSHDDSPPFTHRLVYLAEKAGLELSDAQAELLEIITDFNLESRYPDEKFSFQMKCTADFTRDYLERIEEVRQWLLRLIQS